MPENNSLTRFKKFSPMVDLAKKIGRKTGVFKIVYHVKKVFIKNSRLNPFDPDQAKHELNTFCPDVDNSCIEEKKLNKNYDLEIIIPAYNVERYVAQCLESVKNQATKYRYHVTVVEDGATDTTAQIVDRYKNLENWTVIHQENAGFSEARNTGIRAANAKYILFLDSDDCLTDGAIEKLMTAAFENDADIVTGGYDRITENGTVKGFVPVLCGEYDTYEKLHGFAWGKVMKSDFFEKLSFPVGYYYEDSIMAQIIYPLANKIYGVDGSSYQYRTNSSGITRKSKFMSKCVDSVWITLRLHKDRKELKIETDQKYFEYILRMVILTYYRTQFVPEQIQEDIFTLWADFICRDFNGFHTNKHQDLEYALRNRCYRLYKAYCGSHDYIFK